MCLCTWVCRILYQQQIIANMFNNIKVFPNYAISLFSLSNSSLSLLFPLYCQLHILCSFCSYGSKPHLSCGSSLPFTPHNSRYPLPSVVIQCFPSDSFFFLFFPLFNLCVFNLFKEHLALHSCRYWYHVIVQYDDFCCCFHTLYDWAALPGQFWFQSLSYVHSCCSAPLSVVFHHFNIKRFTVMLQGSVLNFCVSFPTRSVLFTWLRPAGCWICCSSWYRTIVRTRTKNRNTNTLQTSHRRHWMRMPRSWRINWIIFPDTSPSTRSCYLFYNLKLSRCC